MNNVIFACKNIQSSSRVFHEKKEIKAACLARFLKPGLSLESYKKTDPTSCISIFQASFVMLSGEKGSINLST